MGEPYDELRAADKTVFVDLAALEDRRGVVVVGEILAARDVEDCVWEGVDSFLSLLRFAFSRFLSDRFAARVAQGVAFRIERAVDSERVAADVRPWTRRLIDDAQEGAFSLQVGDVPENFAQPLRVFSARALNERGVPFVVENREFDAHVVAFPRAADEEADRVSFDTEDGGFDRATHVVGGGVVLRRLKGGEVEFSRFLVRGRVIVKLEVARTDRFGVFPFDDLPRSELP